MRVLFTSTPGTGHIHPIVPVAAALQAAGHEVLWATGSNSCPTLERYGFRTAPAGLSVADRNARFAQHAPRMMALPPRERRMVAMPVNFGQIAAMPMRDDLIAVFDDFRPDAVVHDLVELAAAPMAASRRIPHVTVAFSGLLSDALESAFTESATHVWAAEGLTVSAGAGMYDHLYLHPFPASLDPSGLDPAALDPGALNRPNVRRMKPLNFDGGTGGEPPEWVAAFGAERPGVYVTFGTEVAALAPWPAVIEAIGALDVDAVLTLGPHVDPDGLPPVPPNIRVERYVPQTCLLDRARLVVSHAGAGTLLAAATRGLPQLCIPIAADQWDNADAITRIGAALTLEPPQRDAATIHSVLETLLADARIGAASVRLADDFAALPHPDNYVETITNLVTGN